MSNGFFRRLTATALTAFSILSLTACGSSSNESASKDSGEGVITIKVGIRQDLYPTSFINEEGEPDGYDVAIMKAIDEKLEQYEFKYEAVSQEALLTGLATGTYQVAAAGFYSNNERREKFLFPQEYIAGNIIGLMVRQEDSDIKNLSDLAASGKHLVPTAPTSGMYGIIVKYNEENPDNQVEVIDSEWNDAATEFKWISEGRYDAALASKNVVDEILPQLDYGDNLVFNKFTAIKTWTLFNPDQQELADAYDEAIRELREEGIVSKYSEEFFGEDVLPFIESSES